MSYISPEFFSVGFRLGCWQFIADMPFNNVSKATMWKLLWLLHQSHGKMLDVSSIPPVEKCIQFIQGNCFFYKFLVSYDVVVIQWITLMIVQFCPYCQVWRLGPLDLTHKAQHSLQPRHSQSESVVHQRHPGFNKY